MSSVRLILFSIFFLVFFEKFLPLPHEIAQNMQFICKALNISELRGGV